MSSDSEAFQTGTAWPVRKAVTLTLLLVFLPYVAAFAVALVNPWALAGIPALAACTPLTFAAVQRLVRFMLTGEVDSGPPPIAVGTRRIPTAHSEGRG
jgi:hypothetical protein